MRSGVTAMYWSISVLIHSARPSNSSVLRQQPRTPHGALQLADTAGAEEGLDTLHFLGVHAFFVDAGDFPLRLLNHLLGVKLGL